MGEAQAGEVGRLEPCHGVVLVRRGVDGCSGPAVDEPDLHVHRLPLLDMTSRQIPHIGVVTASGASMAQQHAVAVAKNGRHDPDPTRAVSGDGHRHILTHVDVLRAGREAVARRRSSVRSRDLYLLIILEEPCNCA
ncbi:hypothetical protein ABIH81_07710 [Micromonospora sp. HUAS YX12]|uniref:Uncharacterized protein n=1 Tax=Micromonospora sp. HUAS YX12 TaxID=3156396 RepID=A0AAU7R4C8_9ACTN